MKLGTENRKKVIAAAVLIAVAMVLMATRVSSFMGLGSSIAAPPQPTTVVGDIPPDRLVQGAAREENADLKKQNPAAQSLDPTLRTDLLRASEDTKYKGTGRNIFKVFVEPHKPIVNPVVAKDLPPPGPPSPPPTPPIELKYYGYTTPQGGIKRIFLAHDKDVFIAREGEIVDRRYKVVRISPNTVEILDVLSNNRQNIPLTQG